MKILVVGGSNGVGKQIVIAALDQGHKVTIFSRNPARIGLKHPNIDLEPGNVLDSADVKAAIKGQDAVFITLGLPTRLAVGPPVANKSYVLSDGTSNVIKAMGEAGVQRLICLTAIGSGDSVRQCTFVCRLTLRYGLRWLFLEKDRQDKLVKASGLDWTIIRPTALTNGRKRDRPETKVGEKLRSGILTQVSRADVAAEMLQMLDQPKTHGKAPVISYRARFGDSIRWLAGFYGLN